VRCGSCLHIFVARDHLRAVTSKTPVADKGVAETKSTTSAPESAAIETRLDETSAPNVFAPEPEQFEFDSSLNTSDEDEEYKASIAKAYSDFSEEANRPEANQDDTFWEQVQSAYDQNQRTDFGPETDSQRQLADPNTEHVSSNPEYVGFDSEHDSGSPAANEADIQAVPDTMLEHETGPIQEDRHTEESASLSNEDMLTDDPQDTLPNYNDFFQSDDHLETSSESDSPSETSNIEPANPSYDAEWESMLEPDTEKDTDTDTDTEQTWTFETESSSGDSSHSVAENDQAETFSFSQGFLDATNTSSDPLLEDRESTIYADNVDANTVDTVLDGDMDDAIVDDEEDWAIGLLEELDDDDTPIAASDADDDSLAADSQAEATDPDNADQQEAIDAEDWLHAIPEDDIDIEAAVPESGHSSTKAIWTSLSAVATIALFAQFAWLNFDTYSRIEPWRQLYGFVCQTGACTLPSTVDRSKIKTYNLVVRSHPREAGALMVDTIILNTSPAPQPFPELVLTFTDTADKPIARRQFKAHEYLAGELTGQSLMPVEQPIHLSLEILDPGPEALGYSIHIR